ncbi:MAG: DNA-directed RNA polymerase [Candidatus Micrarchaeota archaeon]|nr:DNA-directed RNA polymerase [Candidatus Micrarchaeota archaeon]
MYYTQTVKDMFKLPPDDFNKDIEEVAGQILQKKYSGTIDKDSGVIVKVYNVREISDGMIYPGDPSTHHEVQFDMLSYLPYVDEIVIGEVSEIAEFGAFVRIGPIDGLVHVSQITNDFLSFDKKTQQFASKRSGRSLKKGDVVYAKISTVSMKNSVRDSKIALTMKPDGLGKPEWVAEGDRAKRRGEKGSGGSRR